MAADVELVIRVHRATRTTATTAAVRVTIRTHLAARTDRGGPYMHDTCVTPAAAAARTTGAIVAHYVRPAAATTASRRTFPRHAITTGAAGVGLQVALGVGAG